MQIPDWYTGSDPTGRVAAGIERAIQRMDERIADHSDIKELEGLARMEEEVNWRNFLLGLIGTIHYDLEEIDSARTILEDSISAYKSYLPTFDEVLSVYCQSCYTLGVILFDDQEYDDAIPFFMRCLPYMHEVYDETYIGHIYTFLSLCLSWTHQPGYSLVFAEAAAFTRRYDCESLEQLMVAFGDAGEMEKATEVFHMLQEHCQDFESYDRIIEWADQNLGESGVVN